MKRTQLRYDLAKLRGRGLAHRLPSTARLQQRARVYALCPDEEATSGLEKSPPRRRLADVILGRQVGLTRRERTISRSPSDRAAGHGRAKN